MVFFIINAYVVFAFVFVLFSSSSSSNRVSVSYSDQKKTISLIADVYLAKLSLLKRSSSMRNENDDSSDFLERLSMSRQNERRKEAMREAHERTNFIYPVLQTEEKPQTKKKKKIQEKKKEKQKRHISLCSTNATICGARHGKLVLRGVCKSHNPNYPKYRLLFHRMLYFNILTYFHLFTHYFQNNNNDIFFLLVMDLFVSLGVYFF